MNKKPLILSLILTMAFVFAGIQTVSAWNRPTSNPPGNNASAPLHTGSIGQIKEGGLTVGEGSGISVGLRVINGNVAIGLGSTGTPQQKLHVGGNIRADSGFCLNSNTNCITSSSISCPAGQALRGFNLANGTGTCSSVSSGPNSSNFQTATLWLPSFIKNAFANNSSSTREQELLEIIREQQKEIGELKALIK